MLEAENHSVLGAVTCAIEDLSFAPPHQPLTEFTLFPKFPTEIRCKIYKHALPLHGDRSLRVYMKWAAQNPGWLESFEFGTMRGWYLIDCKSTGNEAKKHIGMLRACKESREVYQSVFKHPIECMGGIFRYDDGVKIYIINFMELATTDVFIESILCPEKKGPSPPAFLSTLKHLILPRSFLSPYSAIQRAWNNNILPLIQAMSNLESLTIDSIPSTLKPTVKGYRDSQDTIEYSLHVLSLQTRLRKLEEANSTYKAPTIKLVMDF